MALNASFKAGFLSGLAEEGILPSELEPQLEKVAFIGSILNALSRGALAIPAMLGVGVAGTRMLGRAGGQAAQVITEPTETDISIAKKEEELEEYKRLTAEAKTRATEQAATRGTL